MAKIWWDKWRKEVGKVKFDKKEWQDCYNKAMYEDEGYMYSDINKNQVKNLINQKNPLVVLEEYIKVSRKIIDVGCGYGIHTMRFAKKYPGKAFIGVDIADKVVDKAFEMSKDAGLQNIGFQSMEGEKIKFPSEFFDVAFCFEVLEHVYDVDIVLKEIFRVIRNGGVFVGSVPANEKADGGLHVRQFDKNSLIELLEKYGINVHIWNRDKLRFMFVAHKEV